MYLSSERSAAYVRYFKKDGGKDRVTGCIKLQWESRDLQYAFVDVDNILRIVHIVPAFKRQRLEEGKFLVNRFLFR